MNTLVELNEEKYNNKLNPHLSDQNDKEVIVMKANV